MVGDDAPVHHRFSVRARPMGDGHVELSSVPKLEGYLHSVLTERGLSDDHRSSPVTERRRRDLCRRSRATVDQHDQVDVGGDTVSEGGQVECLIRVLES